jgi:hypothetical protein
MLNMKDINKILVKTHFKCKIKVKKHSGYSLVVLADEGEVKA